MKHAFLTALALTAGLVTAPAALAADIEGRWVLNDGEITVAAVGDGSFIGTVNKAVSGGADYCPKPVGEVMWTEVRPQSDGQYFGQSQYYDNNCDRVAKGLTAFRVLTRINETKYLRACFSKPGSPQPSIAPDGTASNNDFSCTDFPVPAVATTEPPDADRSPKATLLLDAVVKRDGKSRLDVKVTGRIQLPPGVNPDDACKGTASIVLKYKGSKVGSGRASVSPGDCRFKKTIEIKRSKAPKGQLLATATWAGNSLVRGDDGRYFANIPKAKA